MTPFLAISLIALTSFRTTPEVPLETVPTTEREGLIAFYNSTGGPAWNHREGWLGPIGSECHWYGIVCGRSETPSATDSVTVIALEMPDNGLSGTVSRDFGKLRGLRRLNLRGNNLKAALPDELLQRFDEGLLDIEPMSLVHDIEEVRFAIRSPAVHCSGYNAVISATGSVRLERGACDKADDQSLSCEQLTGQSYEFDKFARYLVRSGLFSKGATNVSASGSDLEEVSVTVKRRSADSTTRISRGQSSLSEWSLALILQGIISKTSWNTPPKRVKCSPPTDLTD